MLDSAQPGQPVLLVVDKVALLGQQQGLVGELGGDRGEGPSTDLGLGVLRRERLSIRLLFGQLEKAHVRDLQLLLGGLNLLLVLFLHHVLLLDLLRLAASAACVHTTRSVALAAT